jgi:hypothetical protein
MVFLSGVILSALRIWRRGVAWQRRRVLGADETDIGSERLFDADLAGTFLASIAAILVPALVMDIFAASYHSMLLFLVVGAFYGALRDRPLSQPRRTAIPEHLPFPLPQLGPGRPVGG